jgi:DMSO/TMAO reductase YedYZ molybdopterin-dependent catalytic subunit
MADSGDQINSGNSIYSPDTKRENRIPPGQELTNSWPVLHYGSVPPINTATWKFRIFGLVETERLFTFQEFVSLPQNRVISDIHCVTGWSKLNNTWEGPGSITVAGTAGIKPEAKFVIIHAEKNFTANLPIEDFLQPDVLFALKYNGQELSHEHGYPVRLIVPRLYFWKSAKWVTGIEFSSRDKPGFWESAGYNNHGDPWLEERYR